MMLPVLRAFASGAKNAADCTAVVRKEFAITNEEAAALLPSGANTYLLNRIHWARVYLSKAGLLMSPKRGIHSASPLGLEVLAKSPAKIDVKFLDQFEVFKAWRLSVPGKESEATPPHDAVQVPGPVDAAPPALGQTPDEAMKQAHDILDAALRDDLLAHLADLHPTRFERLILDLLSKMGFGGGDLSRAQMTKASGDGGIDGIIHEDVLGLDRVYIQAKRYAQGNNVGSPAIQQFMGSLSGEGAGKGVFVTTSDFSKDARAFAAKVPHLRIVLIDGQDLARLMIRYGVGIRARTTYVVHGIDEDYFKAASTPDPPAARSPRASSAPPPRRPSPPRAPPPARPRPPPAWRSRPAPRGGSGPRSPGPP
jgi:restriction system protein